MGTYNIDEGVLELPGAWSDQSVNILSRFARDGSRLGLVITRFQIAEGDTLESYVEKQLKDHAQTLRGFELIGRRSAHVGNLPSIEVKIRWIEERGAMFHHLAYVSYYGRFVIFTASSTAKAQADCEKFISEILASAKFRER